MIDYADKDWLNPKPVYPVTKLHVIIFFACIALITCGIPFFPIDVELDS